MTASEFSKDFAGTPPYMAPEIFSDDPYNNKVDIWSLGVVIYELFAGFRPFDDDNFSEL